MSKRTFKTLVATGVLALLAAACGNDDSDNDNAADNAVVDDPAGDEAPVEEATEADEPHQVTPHDAAFEGDDFYDVPDPVPDGEPGTLLRFESIEDDAVPASLEAASAWRIMYLSESIQGEPIAVTGIAVVPSGSPLEGGRRILSAGHGTTGIADQCAPSLDDPGVVLADMTPFVNEGYLVVQTDYEGLGTPGRHPMLVGESEGRGVLDAAKAARQLPEANAGDELAIWGFSQGGRAGLFAGELAAEWAPELDLVGIVAGAPPTEMTEQHEIADGFFAGLFYMTLAGYDAAYPEADLSLVLTPKGQKELNVVDEACVVELLVEHFADADPDELLQPNFDSVEPWVSLFEENTPGQARTDAPTLILHSATDDIVPARWSEQLHDRMCNLGQDVERRVYDGGQDHIGTFGDALADGFEWIQQRFAGEDPVSTCSAP